MHWLLPVNAFNEHVDADERSLVAHFSHQEVQLKERLSSSLVLWVVLLCISLGIGCLWHERGRDGGGYGEEHRRDEHHDDRHEHERR